ncbi:hypothetical protein FPS10_02935 [Pseudoruegeria sp. M32A2M]|nr:hypothetical protein [Pseudoruegeria sp. M32A2M]
MPENNEAHWDSRICTETLSALEYSRANILIDNGFDPQAARLFAMLESERRQTLAREIGADAALLAKLDWVLDCDTEYSCHLVQDDLPGDLNERFFWGFFTGKSKT